jgi:DnaJ family protein C protein 3
LILGKNEQAIRDFDSVLELKTDNHVVYEINKARIKRATLLLYQGAFVKAFDDVKVYLESHPTDAEALELMEKAKTAKQLSKLIQAKECDMEAIDNLMQICPKYVDMLEKRAQCHLKNKETEMAIGDLSRAMKLNPNNNNISLQLSILYASIGELESALNTVKACLRQDPEHRACKKQFRNFKSLQKQFAALEKLKEKKKWSAIISTLFVEEKFAAEVEELGAKSLLQNVYMLACEAYQGTKKFDNAIQYCSKVLEIQDAFLEARIIRAECYLAKDEFEKAKNDFQQAYESDRENERVLSCNIDY